MSVTAPASSTAPSPYPNALQSRQTTAEQRQIAAAAVRAYRATLRHEGVLLQEKDALLSKDEAERLQRRVDDQAAADATATQFRNRACDVLASVQGRQCRDKDSDIDIFHAACDGDVVALDACIRGAADINAIGQPDPARYNGIQFKQRWLFRAPPLVFAAAFGREEAVRFLLAHGADPDVASTTGLRARDYAARRGYGSIVQLVTSGAS